MKMRKEPKAELKTAQFCTMVMISWSSRVGQLDTKGEKMRKEPKPEVKELHNSAQ